MFQCSFRPFFMQKPKTPHLEINFLGVYNGETLHKVLTHRQYVYYLL